jgi:hypothetical protein
MARVGFEPVISAFELEKTIHASDRTATVIAVNTRVFDKFILDFVEQFLIQYSSCLLKVRLPKQENCHLRNPKPFPSPPILSGSS